MTPKATPTARKRRGAVVGIDLAVQKDKRLPVCALVCDDAEFLELRNAQVMPPTGPGNAALIEDPKAAMRFAHATVQYLREIEAEFDIGILRVVIDAPWAPAANDEIRPAEQKLKKLRLSYYQTPSLTDFEMIRKKRLEPASQAGANQIWMLAGFQLFTQISAAGIECVETYPFAVWWALESEIHSKKSQRGMDERMRAINYFMQNSNVHITQPDLRSFCYGAMHDKIDAVMCAMIGTMDAGKRIDIGTKQHPFWLPQTDRLRTA